MLTHAVHVWWAVMGGEAFCISARVYVYILYVCVCLFVGVRDYGWCERAGIVEVNVPHGALGVKLSLLPPLKVLDILELPSGDPSPLAGKVPLGSIVRTHTHGTHTHALAVSRSRAKYTHILYMYRHTPYVSRSACIHKFSLSLTYRALAHALWSQLLGVDGRDITQCSLEDFRAVLLREAHEHVLMFKLPHSPLPASPMHTPITDALTKLRPRSFSTAKMSERCARAVVSRAFTSVRIPI